MSALEAHEQVEHAEHAVHAKDGFVSRVSITIAVLACVTAVTASLENLEASAAITGSSEAVLSQNRASDAWAFYQSKSVKKHVYGLAADQGGPNAARYRVTATNEAKEGDGIQKDARKYEAERDHLMKEVGEHEHRHHRLTGAATLLEMGIAISTIAIITRQKWWWLSSVALGVGGVVAAASAYLLL